MDKQERWTTYHMQVGPRQTKVIYKRPMYYGIESVDFINENGATVGLHKWRVLHNAVTKFKMDNDL